MYSFLADHQKDAFKIKKFSLRMHTPVSILCQVKTPALDNQGGVVIVAYYSGFLAYYAGIPIIPIIIASCRPVTNKHLLIKIFH